MLDFERADDVMLVNSGAICEQFIGQHLLTGRTFFDEPELHYWSREKSQSSAEIDYIIDHGNRIRLSLLRWPAMNLYGFPLLSSLKSDHLSALRHA